ncbi:SEC-C domain-containing protein [Erysipelothrix aquatica]
MQGVKIKSFFVRKDKTLIELLIDCQGKVDGALFFLDYQVMIELPKTFPNVLPICRESGTKRNIIDYHHINTHDNLSFCLGTNIEIHDRLKPDYSLKKYIMIVIEFLTIYEYFLKYKSMPVEERSHGDAGTIEGYFSFFKTDDLQGIINLINKDKINNKMRNQQCPCNSRIKFKKCHFDQTKRLLKEKKTRKQMISELPILERNLSRYAKKSI